MTEPKTLMFKGDHTETGPIADNTHIYLRHGNLVLEGPVGNSVYIQVEGDVTLKADAGTSLHLIAVGAVKAQTVGRDADIMAYGGKAEVYDLGANGWLRSKFGVAVLSPDAKCGNHSVEIGDGVINLYRKPDRDTDEAPSDPDSCFKPKFTPGTPKH